MVVMCVEILWYVVMCVVGGIVVLCDMCVEILWYVVGCKVGRRGSVVLEDERNTISVEQSALYGLLRWRTREKTVNSEGTVDKVDRVFCTVFETVFECCYGI